MPRDFPEQAVRITYQLSGDGYGDPDQRAAILDLKYRLIDAVEAAGAGEPDDPSATEERIEL